MSFSRQRFLRRFCAASLFLAGICASAAAQHLRYSISGTLRDSQTQQGLERVAIYLRTSDGSTVATDFTRQSGLFEFDNVPPGPYEIVLQLDGYEPVRQAVDATLGSIAGVIVSVKRLPGVAPFDAGGRVDVSARELALPQKARDALDKGLARLYEKNDPKGSIPYFAKVLQISPEFYEAHYYTGMAEFFLHDLAPAEIDLRKAIAISGEKYADAFVALASVLEGSNRMAEAEQAARKGVQLSTDSWQGYLELARALLAENRTVEAEDSAVQARTLKPDYADIYITLANIHIRLNDTSALLADVTAYLKLAPTGPYSARAKQIQQSLSRQNQGEHGSH